MPRPLRSQPPGGIFHVTARGNRRQDIFADDLDRERFLTFLAAVVHRYRWRCLAYCLMSNHYHLLIQTPDESLSAGMQRLNGRCAQAFNRRHNVSGHLFQGRFHSVLVESDWHLLELTRYIALNPVRAGLCDDPDDWRWSSYRALARGTATGLAAEKVHRLVSAFGADAGRAGRRYAAFVADAGGSRARDGPPS